MRVHVAIPAYDGKVCVSTAHSLDYENRAMSQLGIESETSYLPGMPLIHIVRNMQVYKFLNESKAEKLAFVDADVGWKMGTLVHLLHHKEHVVAAGVRRRKEPEEYAINFLDSGIEQDPKTGLIEIETIGMALTVITRECLEEFKAKTPELAYGFNDQVHHAFFQSPITGGEAVGEDVFFCRKWRELGGKVWLDPRHWTTHTDGVRTYGGCTGEWLNRRLAETQPAMAAE